VVYDGGAEALWARVLQSIGILAIACVWFRRGLREPVLFE
jgi:hypothetical protein